MELTELIRHPEQLDRDTLYELRSMLALYPYYQTARLLLLQNLYLLHDPSFDEELRRAAIYITDRRVLFQMIEAAHYQLRTPQLNVHAADNAAERENRTITLIDSFLDSIPKEEEKAEKQRQKDAMAEERRLQHEAELRRKELQRAKEEEKARQKKEAAAEKARQKTITRNTTSRRTRSTSRSSKPVLGGFSLSNWKKSAKFIVTAIVVIWYLLTQVKSCSVNDVLQELGIPISIQMNDK